MALVPKIIASEDCARCGCIVIKDITGLYDADNNTGGWGTPNLDIEDIEYIDFQIINQQTGNAVTLSGNGYIPSACSPEFVACGGSTTTTTVVGDCTLCPESITVIGNVPVFNAGCYTVRMLIYTLRDYDETQCTFTATFNASYMGEGGRQFQVKHNNVWEVAVPTLLGSTYTWSVSDATGYTEWRIVDTSANLITSGVFAATDCATVTITPTDPRIEYYAETTIRITCPIEKEITRVSTEMLSNCVDCLDKELTSKEVAKIALCRALLAGIKDANCLCSDFAETKRKIEKILSTINPKPC